MDLNQSTRRSKLQDWKAPTNVTELRSFLGAIGYYRMFISNYSTKTTELCKLLKKNAKYQWEDPQEKQFQLLKEELTKAPILKFPSFKRPFIIRTDASRSGLGGVLLQKKDDDSDMEYPIYYISRSLKKSKTKYGITDLEGSALYYCVKKFKQYIMGNSERTVIITNYKPLVPMIMKNQPNNDCHAKWCEEIRSLNIEVKYEEGRRNVLADALSRMPKTMATTLEVNNYSNIENLEPKDINEFMTEYLNRKIITVDGTRYMN